uniref:Uncharacterized protein n=1 Tax=viral metagenome TaxID=1070528 RepID=A0A6M3M9E0_9ZZZZ
MDSKDKRVALCLGLKEVPEWVNDPKKVKEEMDKRREQLKKVKDGRDA